MEMLQSSITESCGTKGGPPSALFPDVQSRTCLPEVLSFLTPLIHSGELKPSIFAQSKFAICVVFVFYISLYLGVRAETQGCGLQ